MEYRKRNPPCSEAMTEDKDQLPCFMLHIVLSIIKVTIVTIIFFHDKEKTEQYKAQILPSWFLKSLPECP